MTGSVLRQSAARAGVEIIVDLRCLQDPDYAERGIGRYCMLLLRFAREGSPALARARLTGLVDPSMPTLPAAARALVDGCIQNARAAAPDADTWFLQPSPLTHDPLFTAYLLDHPAPLKVAIIHDFIPLNDPTAYLADPARRLDYHVALTWLARYDRHLATSEWTAGQAVGLLPARPGGIPAVGAPLDPVFEARRGRPLLSHILVIGGGDRRKNVDCAIGAHAVSAEAQARGVPLVITGTYDRSAIEGFRALAPAHRGSPGLLRFPGHVADAALLALYQDAVCVVTPSRTEGFSLPVIEAMAAGAPSIGSDIPPHAELIADPLLRFPPDDHPALAAILDRLLRPAGASRKAIVAAQDQVWPRYRAETMAARCWSALEAWHAAAAPVRRRGRAAAPARPRVALLGPLPPARSGVADYTAACVAPLARRVDLALFTDAPSPPPLDGQRRVAPLSALPHLSAEFDRVIGVTGNSDHHVRIHQYLLRYGGASICHDARLFGFYSTLLGETRTRNEAEAELRRPLREGEFEAWQRDESRLEATLLGELARAARPLILHSRKSIGIVRERLGLEAAYLPFAIYRPWPDSGINDMARRLARDRLGIRRDSILVLSLGFVHSNKGPEECIWALEMLRDWGYPARLQFVGGTHTDIGPLQALAEALDVGEHVGFSDGFVSEATYRDYLLAADLGVQLRTYGFGSLSGALQDCVAAGLACVASEDLAESLDAPAYVRRVPDRLSPVLVAEALAELLDRRAHQHRFERERREYCAAHDVEAYCEKLCATLDL